jgi:tetratricopeptide repeat protein
MQITGSRLALTLGFALLLQAGVFAWTYQDLMFFRQPLGAIVDAGPEAFEVHAVDALNRPQITRRHLETIADAAHAFKSPAVELRALERAVKIDPADGPLKLKLADALRRSGQLRRAEVLYRAVLKAEQGGIE